LISYINQIVAWGKTLPAGELNDLVSLIKSVSIDSTSAFEKNFTAFIKKRIMPVEEDAIQSHILHTVHTILSLSNHEKIIVLRMMEQLLSVQRNPSFIHHSNGSLFLEEFLNCFLIQKNYQQGKNSFVPLFLNGLYTHENLSVPLTGSTAYSRCLQLLFSFLLEKDLSPASNAFSFYNDAITTIGKNPYFQHLDESNIRFTLENVFFIYEHFALEVENRLKVFDIFCQIAFEEAGNSRESGRKLCPLLDWYPKDVQSTLSNLVAGKFLILSLEKGSQQIAYLSGDEPFIGKAMQIIWRFYSTQIKDYKNESKDLFFQKTALILDAVINYPFLISLQDGSRSPLQQLLTGFEQMKGKFPKAIGNHQLFILFLFEKYLACASENPALWEVTDEERGYSNTLDQAVHLVIEAAFHRKNEGHEGENMTLFQSLITYVLEDILPTYPNELGLTLIRIIVSPDTGFGFRFGFDRQWAEQMVEAALALFSQHPHLIGDENIWDDLFSGISKALKEANLPSYNLQPELTGMILEKSASQLNLTVSLENGKETYLLIAGLREILTALSANETSASKHLQLTPGQILSFVELLLDAVIKNPNWITTRFDGKPMIREVLAIPFRTLSGIPADQRLGYDLLTQLIESELASIERSPHLMDCIKYGASPSEKTVLEHAFHLVIAWLFPPGERAGLHKTKQLMDVMAYAIEDLVAENPNTTGLAILELILSDAVGLDLSNGMIEDQTDELVEAVLLAIATQPELIQEAPGLREIAQESAGAIHLLSIDHPDIGLEILRNLFEESAGRLTILLEVNGTQFRHLLIEALQQFATAISMERKNGRYTIKLSEDQMLDLVQIIFEGVVEQPEWVEDEYIHQVLDAILQAVDAKSGGRRIPYLLVSLLFQALLPLAQERSELLEKIAFGEKREAIAISYVVERLLNLLLGLDLKDWRKVTQDEAIEAIVHFYLHLINQWDMSAASIEAAMTHLKQLVRQFAAGTLSQDEFLDLLSEDSEDED
jgi:hypothetical protein